MFSGIIIAESLADLSVLHDLHIKKTTIKQVTEKHKTPWVRQWTMHEVEIPEDEIERVAEQLSHCIDLKHAASWYTDFKNDSTHYVIFSNKVFKIDRSQRDQYNAAVAYGASIGIPKYQLDFNF